MPNRIRVVQMFYSFDVEAGGGGVTRFALELGKKLDPEHFEVIYCSLGYYSTPLGHQRIAEMREQNIWAFEANPRWFEDRPYLRFFRAVQNMQKEFARYPVHILHSHSEYTDIAAILLKPQLKTPRIVRTVHYGFLDEWRNTPMRRALLTNLAYPLMLDAEIGINQAITDRLNRRHVARLLKRKATRIYNAVSLERFSAALVQGASDEAVLAKKASLGIPPDAPVIGSVGRLEEQKAYHILVDAAPAVLEKFPQAYFLIVGDGSLAVQIKEQARRLGVEERLILTGARRDVEELLRCMNLFVSTSLWEGLPTVILEAMACQAPVIATDIPGTNELVQHDHDGRLTPPGDSAALAAAINALLADPASGRRLAHNARQTVEAFTIQAVAQAHQRLYADLCQRYFKREFPELGKE